jgi:hypothetical protein
MEEKIVKKNHDIFVVAGILVYILGYVFLSFVGNNYTGVMSFLAPAFILCGAIITVVALVF